MNEITPLQAARLHFRPPLPRLLRDLHTVAIQPEDPTTAIGHVEQLKTLFPETFGQPLLHLAPGTHPRVQQDGREPKRVGVVLSGGQAAGGHNVIAGLFDGLHQLNPDSALLGFVGGPSGIVDNQTIDITSYLLAHYRNLGGFDIIGSGRTKIETPEQLAASLETVRALKLDGLVIIGGDDSNTNAAILAEYFKTHDQPTSVIGVPKTIDGDLKNDQIEISFGHDTACRVYSELIGNLMRDALSARKYYHFIRLMGRSASHITLECALQTHPTFTFIGEEVRTRKLTLRDIVSQLAKVIEERAAAGKHYGAILIPEGLIEFIPEVGALITELNDLLSQSTTDVASRLSPSAHQTFVSLPEAIQKQLLIDRDPHGNVQVSRIETEQLLIEMTARLTKFSAVHHFFGYEGRSAMPSNFDSEYCQALGYVAARLIQASATGYMAAVRNLARPSEEWTAAGVPLTSMMTIETRHGQPKPVIEKALVDLDGAPFATLQAHRTAWATDDHFRYPGPIQFAGDASVVEQLPITLILEGGADRHPRG
jgi:diphosphate-dependent phosphofructokinase